MEEMKMMVNVESTLKMKMNILESKYCKENNTLKLRLETLMSKLSNTSKKNEELNKVALSCYITTNKCIIYAINIKLKH